MRITKRQLRKIIREEYQRMSDEMLRLRTGGARGEARRRKRVMRNAVIVRIVDIVKQVKSMYPQVDTEALRDAIFEVIEDATNTMDL